MEVGRRPSNSAQRSTRWEHVYQDNRPDAVSWYQPEPVVSLELIDVLGVGPESAVLDIGGGASFLVDRLLARGFVDVTVLDISEAALRTSRRRLGDETRVTWLTEDLLVWEPPRRYDLWHDRAVLHFLSQSEVEHYREVLDRALSPAGSVVLGTFASDGPQRCSGLPVARYSPDELGAVLGGGFGTVVDRREVHSTPTGAVQAFTWIAARRTARRRRLERLNRRG